MVRARFRDKAFPSAVWIAVAASGTKHVLCRDKVGSAKGSKPMAWQSRLRGSGAGLLACLALGLALAGAGRLASAQDQSADTPKDTIFARKILMDTIDHNMDALEEMVRSGAAIDFADAHEHADTISVMLMAFPHLFPPSTNQWRPNVDRDPGRDTYASPELWTNFADFYRQAAAASRLAYTASRTEAEADFKKTMAELRTACDFCHARFLKVDKEWVDPFQSQH
jgi:cytochrome c556